MSPRDSQKRLRLAIGGVLVTLLLAAVFTLGSLHVPLEPSNWREILVLYAVSSFITAALLVFGLILTRTILRLLAERSARQLGARFKKKMVLGAMSISLLPVVFMFFVSYALLNRTVDRWFPRPLEIANEESRKLLDALGQIELPRLQLLANQVQPYASGRTGDFLDHAAAAGADAAWILDPSAGVARGGVIVRSPAGAGPEAVHIETGARGEFVRSLPSTIELWSARGQYYLAARVPLASAGERLGYLVVGRRTTPDFLTHYNAIEQQTQTYGQEKQYLRGLKKLALLVLFLFTILLLFAVMWVALSLAKQVTVPIQALAEGTREVSAGNFDYQVPEQAQDELGILVRSFNQMTVQLRDSRRQIDEFTRSLQQAVQELERRRHLMETVLENIPTGVLSLDPSGAILSANSAVLTIFGESARSASTFEDLFGAEASRIVEALMRRSLRMGVVSREIELDLSGRLIHAVVTVSSLGTRQAHAGYVIVVSDLTELLRAQKSAAWQEVAQRIAHEIKNPLTPIQLSAQRLLRHLEQRLQSSESARKEEELTHVVRECAALIERESKTLSDLVNEFSAFVRFPAARMAPCQPNAIVEQALDVFSGRLDGITMRARLADALPDIRADAELLRRVLVNLIDNAAEALEGATVKQIEVSTRLRPETDTVEIAVADTGHGISPQDKDKLFLPRFSTKDRGTGLGLAIAARIIAEHGGTIRVQDNVPVGSRFVLDLPVAEAPLTPRPD
ncbi:MAG: ATP-binding protein [Candidatus Acidiferrales bacterium]|jgi:PAS domain S-box-containing protein